VGLHNTRFSDHVPEFCVSRLSDNLCIKFPVKEVFELGLLEVRIVYGLRKI